MAFSVITNLVEVPGLRAGGAVYNDLGIGGFAQ